MISCVSRFVHLSETNLQNFTSIGVPSLRGRVGNNFVFNFDPTVFRCLDIKQKDPGPVRRSQHFSLLQRVPGQSLTVSEDPKTVSAESSVDLTQWFRSRPPTSPPLSLWVSRSSIRPFRPRSGVPEFLSVSFSTYLPIHREIDARKSFPPGRLSSQICLSFPRGNLLDRTQKVQDLRTLCIFVLREESFRRLEGEITPVPKTDHTYPPSNYNLVCGLQE